MTVELRASAVPVTALSGWDGDWSWSCCSMSIHCPMTGDDAHLTLPQSPVASDGSLAPPSTGKSAPLAPRPSLLPPQPTASASSLTHTKHTTPKLHHRSSHHTQQPSTHLPSCSPRTTPHDPLTATDTPQQAACPVRCPAGRRPFCPSSRPRDHHHPPPRRRGRPPQMPPRNSSALQNSFAVSDADNVVVCPLKNHDGSSCRKRCFGVSPRLPPSGCGSPLRHSFTDVGGDGSRNWGMGVMRELNGQMTCEYRPVADTCLVRL